MNHLPKPLDGSSSPLARAATYLLVPIVVVVALPFLVLLALLLYLAAMVQGARVFVQFITGKEEPAESGVQGPIFIDAASAKPLSDQSTAPRFTDERGESLGQGTN
jgi:hypothetical protein